MNNVERGSEAFKNSILGKATEEDKAILEEQRKRNLQLREKLAKTERLENR